MMISPRLYCVACYDVNTQTKEGQRRLRRVARICESYGLRVQNSVFELSLTHVDYDKLILKVTDVISKSDDSFRVYILQRPFNELVKVFGVNRKVDPEQPLIV